MVAKTGAAYVARLQTILDKLGTNGTKIPDGTPPPEIKGNEGISKWHDTNRAIAEYLIASNIKRVGEAREKKAKARVEALLGLTDADRVPGTSVAHVYDNVSLTVKVTNPRVQLDRSKLITALAKKGLKEQEISKIIADSETETAAPRTLTAATTAE